MATNTIQLPRGGTYVRTSAGAIQFGIPPETIKDAMEAKLDVPNVFVVPSEPFDRKRGVNVAEFEFPAYFNFFILKRPVRLVVDDLAIEDRLRAVIQESLFGPKASTSAEEFAAGVPEDARPNFIQESAHFRNVGGKRIEIEALVNFIHFDASGVARLAGGVEIAKTADGYVVRDNGAEIARAPKQVALPERAVPTGTALFNPPEFGVTVLGASHGFDPAGKTTGFVIWAGGRGVLVDPPVGSTEYLRGLGIPSKVIDGVILTHCHADHDSGTFQKILEEGKLNVYTTPTVLGSFLRKYSALSGLGQDLLRRTFTFKGVKIGEPIRIHGAEFHFFYALHSIPAVGFEAFYGGRSLAFSSDTLYDPVRIRDLARDGVIGRRRCEDLINFPWHHSIVLHEAGIPPLHTPVSALAALPESARKNLHLVHIAEKDLPKDCGLRVAPVGLQNTIRLPVVPPQNAEAVHVLDVLCSVDLFRDFTMQSARECLQMSRTVSYLAGTKILAQGSEGGKFYVVMSGTVSVAREGKELKTYDSGDYFGETAIVLGQPRNADVFAKTAVELIEIEGYDFLYLLRGTDIVRRLERLATLRASKSWDVLLENSVLRSISSAQKTELQSLLEVQPVTAGEALWTAGGPARHAIILDDAQVSLEGTDAQLAPFERGAFLGEVDALLSDALLATTARVTTAGQVFRISRENLVSYFRQNPGLLVSFIGARFVE